MSKNPIETTTEIFTRFGAKDVPGIVELLADDIRIDFYGPSVIPYAGSYQGKDEARRFFETVLSSVDIHQFDAEQIFSSGEMVTVTGELHLTARSTGRPIKSSFAHVITVRDGKWVRFRDFMNTAVAVAAFQQ
ncbi:nuclear transport factor 2 family protein [Panacagrimonas sp.]|uniref:nuclear transport factor 2 family protein n=1 Tax=Panacagrimonas sp. TaxID=2480088 RepID=UPI003B52CDEC